MFHAYPADTWLEAPKQSFPSSLSADEFKALFRGHPGGVAVITADAGEGPVALTASSVVSVSAEPPLLIFSVSALSSASEVLSRAETVVAADLDTFAAAGLDTTILSSDNAVGDGTSTGNAAAEIDDKSVLIADAILSDATR